MHPFNSRDKCKIYPPIRCWWRKATYLGEGDEALVAVILPCLGGNAEELAGLFGFYPFATGVIGVASGDEVDDLLQRGMEVAPFFFRHYEQ